MTERLPPAGAAATPALDLDACAREPIHIPGAIQPQGALLACDQKSFTVLSASANSERFLGLAPAQLTGRRLASVFDPQSAAVIRSTLDDAVVRPHMPSLIELRLHDGSLRSAKVHAHLGVVYIELGATGDAQVQTLYAALQNTYPVLGSMTQADSLESMLSIAAGYVKLVSGLDRVMVYRFDEHWNGEVIEEQCSRADLPLYFGLRFPASDIPAQARALYRTGLIRYIADVSYTPVPLEPQVNPHDQRPFDLGYCTLRSVSPVHLQYLKNMGVSSTLVISIVVDGELWGLISCHHYAPTALTLVQPQVCGMVALVAGAMVKSLQDQQRGQQRARQAKAKSAIIEAFNVPGRSVEASLRSASVDLTKLLNATGGVLWLGDRVLPFGHVPHAGVLAGVLAKARESLVRLPEQAWQRIDLADASFGTPVLGGALAIALDPRASDGLLWLRPELRQVVLWGGDPDKPAIETRGTDGGITLSPRQSFEAWKQTIQGECAPWRHEDLEAALSLRALGHMLDTQRAHEQLRASEDKFRSLTALSSDAYWETDAEHRVKAVADTRLGALAARLPPIGQPLASAFIKDAVDARPLLKTLERHDTIRDLECHAVQPDGSHWPLLLNAEPVHDDRGAFVGYRGTLSDASARWAAAAARTERDAAEQANVAKTLFLSHMSHELRTPLAAVLAYAQMLELSETRPLDAAQREWVRDVLKAGNHLQQVIDELMDLSLIEAGQLKLVLEPVDLEALVGEVLHMIEGPVEARSLAVSVDLLDVQGDIVTDAKRLRQVLLNLLGNAAKYTAVGGRITVTARRVDLRSGPALQVDVGDNGCGISEADLKHLFEPFNRFGHDRGVIAGTGIGLVITRRLVEAMGGQLTVVSEVGVGTTFSFSMAIQPLV
jgi:light-regulated signal transduction histidine kinase (bacteriophytochrome)